MKRLIKFVVNHKRVFLTLVILPFIFLGLSKWFLPDPLFSSPVSLVVEDRVGKLLGAKIAADGQWRFPYNIDVPSKFRQAAVCFEDKRFDSHFGTDPIALVRATVQNVRSGKTDSGGSTITMQLVRLARKKPRNIFQKAIEIMLSVYLELFYSKAEIFALYASQAPFGGNVIGLDAAAWRYFGKNPNQLSWSEVAALAVLPNNPSMVHPGRNRITLEKKRNYLLDKLLKHGIIDKETCQLSKLENLPWKPLALPNSAPQLLDRIFLEKFDRTKSSESKYRTTVDETLQNQVLRIVEQHSEKWTANGINNAAALVLDVETGNTLAYIGNTYKGNNEENNNDVDIIVAPRSPGSTLKPLLFTAMLSDGMILPTTLVPDIPTQIAGYSPKNFNMEYDGAVSARNALSRSLNVPAIRMLRSYGVERFHLMLQRMGMTTINKPASHYGLSLILGGGETSLWELCGIYSSMARMLNHYSKNSGRYNINDWHMPSYFNNDSSQIIAEKNINKLDEDYFLDAGSVWTCFEAMEDLMRPGEEALWKEFNITQKIAWKTGTSYGYRDAWAIGCTPKYIVGVWVGNADGEGRPGLTGISAAAPVMFNVFSALPKSNWFEVPYDNLEKIAVCNKSGFRALDICEEIDSVRIPKNGMRTGPCPYHQMIHLDYSGSWRVNSECESTSSMIHKSWFVLPPAMEWYYKLKNQQYKVLPDFRKDCIQSSNADIAMEIIYPKQSTKIYVPIEIDGSTGKTIFEVAHRSSNAIIYWHLDEQFMGYTKGFHQLELSPRPGLHTLNLVDENGERLSQNFEIIGKEKK